MSSQESVSVVIPAYNAEQFIGDAVKSCFAQTYRPLEVVVVNDGSTDLTVGVVNDLRRCVPGNKLDLRIINIGENKGAGNALSAGFSSAVGEYVCWLSADDLFIDQEKIRRQVDQMKKSKALWSYFRDYYAGSTLSRKVLVRSSFLPRLPILNPLFIRNSDLRLMMLPFRNPMNGSSMMIAKHCIETFGQFEPVRNADHDNDLWMRYSALRLKLIAIRGAPIFARRHPGQVSTNVRLITHDSDLTGVRILLALDKKGDLVRLIKEVVPYLSLVLMSKEHLRRPFMSEFLFNYILDHRESFNPILIRYVRRSLNDLRRHPNFLMFDKTKFYEDLSVFKESPTFKKFEEIFLI
jgi:glycosyltransferase involved in cell wall biosynthesis